MTTFRAMNVSSQEPGLISDEHASGPLRFADYSHDELRRLYYSMVRKRGEDSRRVFGDGTITGTIPVITQDGLAKLEVQDRKIKHLKKYLDRVYGVAYTEVTPTTKETPVAIEEKVSASIDFKFPTNKSSDYSSDRIPTGETTIKELEDYLFNCRMRGGEDGTKVKVNYKKFYSAYGSEQHATGFTVPVNATIDGFSSLPAKIEAAPSRAGVLANVDFSSVNVALLSGAVGSFVMFLLHIFGVFN